MEKVIIFGGSGHAKVIADIITKSGDEVVGFLDDNLSRQGQIVYQDKKVLGTIDQCAQYSDCKFIIGIGNNTIRKKLAETYFNLDWYTAIHPNAIIANDTMIEEGSVIAAGAVVNPGTKIGKHTIINTSATIDHDNMIGDFVHVSPGAHLAGTVTLEEGNWVCIGASIINNVTIKKNNIIGAGAVVVKDIDAENKVFIGIPAREKGENA